MGRGLRLTVVAAVVSACSGGAAVPPPDVSTDASTPDASSREERIAVRLRSCRGVETGCHDASNPAGLELGRGAAVDFATLIGVRSSERPDLLRVAPRDALRSWLYLKVGGAADAETAMPLGTKGDPAFAAELRAWIDDGAPNPFVAPPDGGVE